MATEKTTSNGGRATAARATAQTMSRAAGATRARRGPTTRVRRAAASTEVAVDAIDPTRRSIHRTLVSLAWFPDRDAPSPEADKLGYLSPLTVRESTRLPFNVTSQALLAKLEHAMASGLRPTGVAPALTSVGQMVERDLVFDASSTLDAEAVGRTRAPALDLHGMYGRGPALDPFLYRFPTSGRTTAIKMAPVPHRSARPGLPSDLRPTMLRFHDAVVDRLLAAEADGHVFVEAKRIVTHHYQWAVVQDLLTRVCGAAAVLRALGEVTVPVNGAFRMPAELAVTASCLGRGTTRHDLLRGLALGLPSGQGMAELFGFPALTDAQLEAGLPPSEAAVLDAQGQLLRKKTPLGYYVLREAAVLHQGQQLGPVGGKIVADTFVRMLKRDGGSYLNASGFTPILPSAVPGEFTFADLVRFAGVTPP